MLRKNCALPTDKTLSLLEEPSCKFNALSHLWTRFKYALCTRAQANALSNDTGKH